MIVSGSPVEHLVCCRPLPGVSESSDATVTVEDARGVFLALIDGAGQGAAVREASLAAARVVTRMAAGSIADIFVAAHRALDGTPGASLAVLRIPAGRPVIQFAGVGRVYGAIAGGQPGLLTSEPGRLGVGLPKVPPIHESPWRPGSLAVLVADGVVDVWDLGALWRMPDLPLVRVAERLAGVEGRLPEDASIVLARGR